MSALSSKYRKPAKPADGNFCQMHDNINKAAVLPAALKGRVYEKVLYHICDDINITDNFEQSLSTSLKKDKISKVFITLFLCVF